MVSARAGRSTLGCLLTLLVVAAVVYFGVNVGETYLRYLRFRDSMEQVARFAGRYDDATIRNRLALAADTLGLPESAKQVQVRRRDRYISIWADYYERIELPMYVKEVHFVPRVDRSF